jgi:hypothetical protein
MSIEDVNLSSCQKSFMTFGASQKITGIPTRPDPNRKSCTKSPWPEIHVALQYLGKETFFWAEIFKAFYPQIDLSVDKISGRNTVIWFIGI